jgi:MFS family permease
MTDVTETAGRSPGTHPAGPDQPAAPPANVAGIPTQTRTTTQQTGVPAHGTGAAPATGAPAGSSRTGGSSGRVALTVLLFGQFMAVLDVSIVNVALPTLRADLKTSDSGLQLVVAGYILSYAVLLITGARLGGIVGHRRTFLTGLGVFTLASLACGLAPTSGSLIVFRFVQGAGAALMTPQVMSIIQRNFTGAARARALGLYTAVVAGGVVVGQAAGGLLVSADIAGYDWRPVFLLNVPIGAVLLAAGPRVLPKDHHRAGGSLDVPGLLALTPAVLLIVLPLILGHDEGWPAWCVASLIAGVVLFGAFIAVERRVAARGGRPLISPRMLRVPALVPATAALIFGGGSWGAFLFTTTLHLQGQLRMTPLRSGLAFVPCIAAFALVSLTWQRFPAAWHRWMVPAGFALAAGSYVAIGPLAGGGAAYETITGAIGLGLGVLPIVITLALEHVPLELAPDASGLLLTVMQLGQVIGVATIGTLFLTVTDNSHSTRHAEYSTGWALAGAAAVSTVTAIVLAQRRKVIVA